MVVDYTSGAPEASTILTYGQVGNSATNGSGAGAVTHQFERYAAKEWRTVLLTDDDILADPDLAETVVQIP